METDVSHCMNPTPWRRTVGVGAALLASLGLLWSSPAPVAADDAPRPKPGHAWFGPQLDWAEDSFTAYQRRFDLEASLVSRPVAYPLTRSSLRGLGDLARAAGAGGAIAVVDLQPSAVLTSLQEADAVQLTTQLNRLSRETGASFLLRFGPEMNGTWTPWGQQPSAYVAAFRGVAAAVHARALAASMVWSPVYGAGYPFGGALGGQQSLGSIATSAGPTDARRLDTNRSGRLDAGDDPYSPYYPGDRAVDWVGLSMPRFGVEQNFGDNLVPGLKELRLRLDEDFGYEASSTRRSFYARYAEGMDRPMLLATAALYNPQGAGASEAAVKLAWLRRVATAVKSRPLIEGVLWLEDVRYEPEVGARVRWGLSPNIAIRDAAGALIADGPFDLAPVPTPDSLEDLEAEQDEAAPESSGSTGSGDQAGSREEAASGEVELPSTLAMVTVLGSVALLVAAMVALRIRRRRMRPPWLA